MKALVQFMDLPSRVYPGARRLAARRRRGGISLLHRRRRDVPQAVARYLNRDASDRWDLSNATRLRILLVASSGGHLSELVRLVGGKDRYHDFVWVTFDGAQSTSLLADSEVVFTPYVSPRDPIGLVRSGFELFNKLGNRSFDLCISTGSAIALAAYSWAVVRGVPRVYIESVARTNDLSATGKIVHRMRLATVFSQEVLSRRSVPSYVSVLSSYRSSQLETGGIVGRVFVTLGTISPYRFDCLVDSVLSLLSNDIEVVWQLGCTTRGGLPGTVYDYLPEQDFIEECRIADVVICHGGVGTVMSILDLGFCPVVVPRRRSRQEHVDDHQREICEVLERFDIGVVSEADKLTMDDLKVAVGRRVEKTDSWC